jgi:hypothetical protein
VPGASDRRPVLPALLFGVAAIAGTGQRASADSSAPRPTAVDVAVMASGAEAEALAEAVAELGPHMGLRMRVAREEDAPSSPSPGDVFARVWIDARASDRIDVRIASAAGGSRPYERQLPRDGSLAVVTDEVAQVVGAALESMVAVEAREAVSGGADGAPKVGPGPTPASPAPASAAPEHSGQHGFGLDLAAFGSEEAISAGSGPVFGAGAAVAISAGRAPWRPSLWISGIYDTRFDVRNGSSTFDASTTSFRLVPSVEVIELDVAQVDFGVGGGLDLFRVAPLVVRSSTAVFDSRSTSADPLLTGQLLIRLRLAPQIALLCGFDLDYDWAPHPTTVAGDHPGARRGEFEASEFRPSVEFGLCVSLSKGGACGRPH